MKNINLFFALFCVLMVLSCNHSDHKKAVPKHQEYISVIIYEVKAKWLIALFDTIIARDKKLERYKENNCYDLDPDNDNDTITMLNPERGLIHIVEDSNINGYFMQIVYEDYYLGCVEYGHHLFFIHKAFSNTKWFIKTNRHKFLKSYIPKSNDYFGWRDDLRWGFSVKYKNETIFPEIIPEHPSSP